MLFLVRPRPRIAVACRAHDDAGVSQVEHWIDHGTNLELLHVSTKQSLAVGRPFYALQDSSDLCPKRDHQAAVHVELAADVLVVRAACPKDALERQQSGVVKRYNMRCVGCKSCILACPFGTLFPEVINYITAHCDYCLSQLKTDPEYQPLCVRTAPPGSFRMEEIREEDPEAHVYLVGEYAAVHSPSWRRKEGRT